MPYGTGVAAMRRAAKVDEGHAAVVSALRAAHVKVLSLAAVGKGCPDLLVGWRGGKLMLLEVKSPPGPDGGTSKTGQRLNEAQERFKAEWPVTVVHSPEEALKAVLA
jgi:hypothetical protein